MKRIRSGAGRSRQQPPIGAPDPALAPNAGLAAIAELCDQLGVIGALDAAAGPHQAARARVRGRGAAGGLAAAQLARKDFLTGLDRQRADAAGQQITPVPGLARQPRPAERLRRPRTRRRLPGRQYARYQESWRTKIIYAGDSQLTALFAESGQTAHLSV